MAEYKNTWFLKYKNVPEEAYGFLTCMYVMSLEAWRRNLEVKFFLKRSKSLMHGISYSVSDGKDTHYFSGSRGDETDRQAIRICADKQLTKKYLEKMNVSVPEGKSFDENASVEDIVNYSEKLGYPLVLKPNSGGGGGVGVVTNIKNSKDMIKHLKKIKGVSRFPSVIVERYFVGEDYRINVLNGKILGAFHRRAQSVVGDGIHNIQELLRLKNEERSASPFLAKGKLKLDKRMIDYLEEQDKSSKYVPDVGERVYVRRNGEFFGQRDAVDMTEELSDNLKHNAIQAVEAIPGLNYAGVDMLIDFEKDECIVNEVNSLPQISNHIFPMEGNARDIPQMIMDYFFPGTAYKNSLKDRYYYDFRPIIDNFRNGTASEVKLPQLPKKILVTKKYTLFGEMFNKKYLERMKKEAVGLSISGVIKVIDQNQLEFIVLGTELKIQKLYHILQKPPFRYVKIKKIQTHAYSGYIRQGIEVKDISS